MGKYNTTLRTGNLSLRGRGLENTSATACRDLGYQVVEASSTSKFVEVHGPAGSTLVAFYASWGGFQLQVTRGDLVADLVSDLKAIGVLARPAPGDSTGRRLALGDDKGDLAKALALVIGEVGEKVEKVEVQAPLQALKAPAIAAPGVDLNAITVAALAAGKSTDEVLAIIAALKA